MRYSIGLRLAVASCLLFCAPSKSNAQQKPTVDQARVLLQTRPDLVALMQQKLTQSGMTPDQIRARLQAEGYPSNLLDSYLPGGLGSDSGVSLTPNVFSAVAKLGIADTSDFGQWRPGDALSQAGSYSLGYSRRDSLMALWLDSIRLHPRGLPRGISGAAAAPDSG